MKSNFYYQGNHKTVAEKIKKYLNNLDDFLTPQTVNSTRAVGDALESILAGKFQSFLGDWCKEYSNEFARRAMADMAFTDVQGIYSVVDVKTHRKDTKFNMPNLTSVERLSRFYESDKNVFSIIMIKYSTERTKLNVTEVIFSPIEFLDWECLTIGALGWGQIQIANSNTIKIIENHSRKSWMLELCDLMLGFYPKEIAKIKDRSQKFENVKAFWESKEDVWKNEE